MAVYFTAQSLTFDGMGHKCMLSKHQYLWRDMSRWLGKIMLLGLIIVRQ